VRESASPGATLRLTARSLAVIVVFGVKELTRFSFALTAPSPDGLRKNGPAATLLTRPRMAPEAGLPAAPCGPGSPFGPCGRLPARKSLALSEPRLTFAPVTALAAISAFLTAPFLIWLGPTLFFGSLSAA